LGTADRFGGGTKKKKKDESATQEQVGVPESTIMSNASPSATFLFLGHPIRPEKGGDHLQDQGNRASQFRGGSGKKNQIEKLEKGVDLWGNWNNRRAMEWAQP